MTQVLILVLEGLILTLGIFGFLRLVRSSRGGRLVRGLVITLLVGIVGLWLLAEHLGLEHLQWLVRSSVLPLVVLFAVLFQPELRHGIAQLGGAGFLGRLLKSIAKDATSEVARACVAMASRKHGALIAFERENPLDAYIEGGVQLDSEVSHLLIESVFQPGGMLHDGAVIVRGDRIAAASCLFPLTENLEIARSTGTRHRAALGLADETDAVTVVVSEETGKISVCKRGEIQESIPQGKLEEVLREVVGRRDDDAQPEPSEHRRESLRRFFRHDLLWLVASSILASAILYATLEATRDETRVFLHVTALQPEAARPPEIGELVLLLPSEDYTVVAGPSEEDVELTVRGSHAQVVSDEVRRLGGTVRLGEATDGPLALVADEVEWSFKDVGLDYAWTSGATPEVRLGKLDTVTVELVAAHVPIDTSSINARWVAQQDDIGFSSPTVEIRGPAEEVAQLPLVTAAAGAGSETGVVAPIFRPIVIGRRDDRDVTATLTLSSELASKRCSLVGEPVLATVPLLPASFELSGEILVDIALICTDTARMDELSQLSVPPQYLTRRVTINTSGLIPQTAEPEAVKQYSDLIQSWVEENLVVFVDIRDTSPADDRFEVQVKKMGVDPQWRDALPQLLGFGDEILARAGFEVTVHGSKEFLLESSAPGP